MVAVHGKARLISGTIACGLALGAIVVAPVAAMAKQPGPPAAQLDTVTASGSGVSYTNLNISAESGPSGEHPSGSVFFTVPGVFDVGGPVTCLSVAGNAAVLNYTDPIFGIVTIILVDNGGGGRDLFYPVPTGRAPSDCSPLANFIPTTLSDGRVVVSDAQPLPTTKGQCKQGGWAQYGFSNQGQCIKFVNHP